MSIDPSVELVRFHQFIGAYLAKGDNFSPEEVLDLWRIANPEPDELADDVLAVRQALDDMDRGDTGIPLEEYEKLFRQRHGLPSQ